jgi:hypothetical protein
LNLWPLLLRQRLTPSAFLLLLTRRSAETVAPESGFEI